MTRRLRFSGEWPPVELWDEYPNREYALVDDAERRTEKGPRKR